MNREKNQARSQARNSASRNEASKNQANRKNSASSKETVLVTKTANNLTN